jgi:hypothetical protein
LAIKPRITQASERKYTVLTEAVVAIYTSTIVDIVLAVDTVEAINTVAII